MATCARGRYFEDAKPVLLEVIDPRGLRILDAGCAAGGNGVLMKRAGAREVVGIEVDEAAAGGAPPPPRLDTVFCADLAAFDFTQLGHEPFDAVLAVDVLEHLAEPEAILAKLVAHLRPGGLLVACIPNVAHAWVILNLLVQRWPRRDAGIFDRTHLRFFARRDMVALLRGAGLEVTRVEPYYTRYRSLKALAYVLSLYVFRSYYARQYLLVGRTPS